MSDHVFAPICLYTNSLFKTRDKATQFIDKYIVSTSNALVLVCDTLHAYSLMVRHSYDCKKAKRKAQRQGESQHQMMSKLLRNVPNRKAIRLCRWDEIASDAGYTEVMERIESALTRDDEFRGIIAGFCAAHVRRLSYGRTGPIAEWERRYVLSEIAMSVYVTEILGYWHEVWENVPGPELVDPLTYLYDSRRSLVLSFAQVRETRRRLEVASLPQASHRCGTTIKPTD